MLRALKAKRKWFDSLKEMFQAIPNLRPKVSAEFDQLTGHPSLGFSLDHSSEKDIKEMIQDVLVYIEKLGERVILAIDEFQKITEIDNQGWLDSPD